MIYEYCLVVQGDLNPYPTHYEQQDNMRPLPRKPDIALLQVNHLVRDEAQVVLYEQNMWRLSAGWLLAFTEKSQGWRGGTKNLIRRLVVSFDVRDLDSAELLKHALLARLGWAQQGSDNRMVMGHDLICARLLAGPWWFKIDFLSQMKVTNVTLDFTNCYCPNGCCRLVEDLHDDLKRIWDVLSFDAAVTITGWHDQVEADNIAKYWKFSRTTLDPKGQVEIT